MTTEETVGGFICEKCGEMPSDQIQSHECDPVLKRVFEIGKRFRAGERHFAEMARVGFTSEEKHLAARAALISDVLCVVADLFENKGLAADIKS